VVLVVLARTQVLGLVKVVEQLCTVAVVVVVVLLPLVLVAVVVVVEDRKAITKTRLLGLLTRVVVAAAVTMLTQIHIMVLARLAVQV
jgi:hypothetical protein